MNLYNVELPFELRALNVALEAICSFLDARTNELELDAHLALDELTSKVNLLLNSLCFSFDIVVNSNYGCFPLHRVCWLDQNVDVLVPYLTFLRNLFLSCF